jgi:hypothetical protein
MTGEGSPAGDPLPAQGRSGTVQTAGDGTVVGSRQARDREIRELPEAAMRVLARDDRREVRHDRS